MVRAELVRLKNGQVVDPAVLRRSAQRKLGHTYSLVYLEPDSEEVTGAREKSQCPLQLCMLAVLPVL